MESWAKGEPYTSLIPAGGTAESWARGEIIEALQDSGEEATLALGGGAHFFRHLEMATVRTSWSPLRYPGLLGWFTTGRNNVVLNGTGEVTSWRNFPIGTLALSSSGADEPDWMQNGWGQGISAIDFSDTGGGGGAVAVTVAGGGGDLIAPGAGTDLPFSLFCTLNLTTFAAQTIASWYNSGGDALSALQTFAVGGNRLRYTRTDDAASSVSVDGVAPIGTGRMRVGILFSGTSVEIYQEQTRVATGAADVGALSSDTFEIGASPANDYVSGRIADVVVINRLCSVAEYIAYYNWSRTVLGY